MKHEKWAKEIATWNIGIYSIGYNLSKINQTNKERLKKTIECIASDITHQTKRICYKQRTRKCWSEIPMKWLSLDQWYQRKQNPYCHMLWKILCIISFSYINTSNFCGFQQVSEFLLFYDNLHEKKTTRIRLHQITEDSALLDLYTGSYLM